MKRAKPCTKEKQTKGPKGCSNNYLGELYCTHSGANFNGFPAPFILDSARRQRWQRLQKGRWPHTNQVVEREEPLFSTCHNERRTFVKVTVVSLSSLPASAINLHYKLQKGQIQWTILAKPTGSAHTLHWPHIIGAVCSQISAQILCDSAVFCPGSLT